MSRESALGHDRRFRGTSDTSGLSLTPDVPLCCDERSKQTTSGRELGYPTPNLRLDPSRGLRYGKFDRVEELVRRIDEDSRVARIALARSEGAFPQLGDVAE